MTEEHAPYNVDKPDSVVTLIGVVDLIKKVPSRQVTQVIIELPYEHFKAAVQHFDAEMVFMQVTSKQLKDAPYGVYIEGEIVQEASKAPAKTLDKVSTGVGPHCFEAIQFCNDPTFCRFMVEIKEAASTSAEDIKDEFCMRCGIDSRKELDTNADALKSAQQIYRQFIQWKEKNADT